MTARPEPEERGEADDLRKVLADIVLNAVLHPGIPSLELVSRNVLDRARMMVDHGDIVAAAERIRARPAPDSDGGGDA